MHGFTKNGLVPFVLRLGLAVIFVYHGLDKVSAVHSWGTAWSRTLPAWLQCGTAWLELLAGFALAVGFLTRAAAVVLAAVTVGAIYFIHGQHGFALQTGNTYNQGYEYKFALLVMCTAVLLLGGGSLAVDRFFRRRPLTSSSETTALGQEERGSRSGFLPPASPRAPASAKAS